MSLPLVNQFLEHFEQALKRKELARLIISNKRNKAEELKSITIKPVKIRKGDMLNFVFRFPTNDLTKNFNYEEGTSKIKDAIEKTFLQGELYTSSVKWHLRLNKKNKGKLSSIELESELNRGQHDKKKKRPIAAKDNKYLIDLGICNPDGSVKPSMQDKYRQINKYIEIIEGIIKPIDLPETFHIADMGSGKGYLTFALYDYLSKQKKLTPIITGIEYRDELVDKCNTIASKAKFDQLKFVQGTIVKSEVEKIDMLIALHACDTATDDAIYTGIKANAEMIICAPCCHKQIRKQLNPANELNLIAQFGILKERQAEILTDTIRSQILEAYGYKTKVFEFISTEHTPKNVMIVGIKKKNIETPNQDVLENIEKIKQLHGIEFHYLEKLLSSK